MAEGRKQSGGKRLYTGAMTFSFETHSREDAEKRLTGMVGAMKQVMPQEFHLEVNGMLSREDYSILEKS